MRLQYRAVAPPSVTGLRVSTIVGLLPLLLVLVFIIAAVVIIIYR